MTLVQLASKMIRELIGRARLKLPVCFVASVEASRGSGSLACSARTKQVVMCKVRLEGLTDRPCESKERGDEDLGVDADRSTINSANVMVLSSRTHLHEQIAGISGCV